jgi:hypothetical protein
MNQESLRIYLLNSLTMMITFTNIEDVLKVMLLFISTIYTSMKIIDWIIIKINNKNVNNNKETLQD